MPKVRVRDIEIYYEIAGEGFPIILIRGLGSNADHWYAQVPAFSKHYRVITFDRRANARSTRNKVSVCAGWMSSPSAISTGSNVPVTIL